MTHAHAHNPGAPRNRDAGRVSVLFAALTTAVVVMLAVGLDAGLTLAAKARAYQLAADAARTGASEVDLDHYRNTGDAILDPTSAAQAAQLRLDGAGADPASTVTATTTQVTVTVWHTQTTQLLGIIGIGSLTTSATATAQARHGITTPGDLP